MERINVTILVLCSFYLTHVVSVSPPHLMVVHSGENVTLQCINVLKKMGYIGWFKQVNSSEPLCITSMWSSLPTVHHQNGFHGNHMKMFIANRTTFLRITEVDVADSGLYFCGMLDNYFIFTNATVLKVQGNLFNKLSAMTPNAQTIILGIRYNFDSSIQKQFKLYLYFMVFPNVQNQDTDALNYAALNFTSKKKKRERRREKELDPHVMYAATR
uniref:Ig-like domain-containing protein n=1 Tax=Salmo trutta TaxID=8032 RepID=A0A674ECY1_SALTR